MHASIVDLLEDSCSKYGERPLFGVRRNGSWAWTTYSAFNKLVSDCASALAQRDINPEDRVALVADNSIEWATTAHATYARGAVFVPMYTAQSPKEWEFILRDSNSKLVFAATTKEYSALVDLKARLPGLTRVIGLDLPADHTDSYEAFLAEGRANPLAKVRPKPEALACCLYTSGTTGEPKGVELSHRNFCSNVHAVAQRIPIPGARSLAFLPWAHAFGQTGELHYLVSFGGCMAINDDVTRIVPNLAEISPTVLIAVPRIFNRIYDGVHKQMAAKPALIQGLFKAGLLLAARKNAGEKLGLLESCKLGLADKLIFSKVRGRFGGKLELVVSGSAALNPDVARFIDALGIMVYEGYGLTETSPVISVNYPGHRKIGSVGPAIPEVTVTLDESKGDAPGEGELIVKGPNVMVGYHNRENETAGVLSPNGELRTGDLAKIDSKGFISITGRIKELYKLENGKYVAPAILEEQLKMSPWIANVVLSGANKPHNVALVVVDPVALASWTEANNASPEEAVKDPRVNALVTADIEKYSRSFKGFERPRAIAVIDEDFTADNGLLTPKMSVKRNAVLKRYQPLLDELY